MSVESIRPSPQDSPDTEMKAAALAGGGSQERQANSGPVLLSRPAPIASFEMSVDLNRSRSGGRFSDVADRPESVHFRSDQHRQIVRHRITSFLLLRPNTKRRGGSRHCQ